MTTAAKLFIALFSGGVLLIISAFFVAFYEIIKLGGG
jgi:hypothetical protein